MTGVGASDLLFEAAGRGDAQTVRAELRSGADPYARSSEGLTALGIAIETRQLGVVRTLLSEVVNPNASVNDDDLPALFLASLRGFDDAIPELVSAGAVLDYAHTALGGLLSAAVVGGHGHTVELLLTMGVPPTLCNAGGATALHVAALTGRLDLVQRLVQVPGLTVQITNSTGGTPLRSAAAGGHLEVVKRLLALGADPAPVDAFGRRPIDDARDNGHVEVVTLLDGAAPGEQRSPPSNPATARRMPFSLLLPEREDATLKGVIYGLRANDRVVQSGASALEAPSALATIEAIQPGFSFSCHIDTDPDPRLPARDVRHELWSYRKWGRLVGRANPALRRPPLAASEEVARLASWPYQLRVWSDLARAGATRLEAAGHSGVLATMVHWLPGPPHLEPWDWRFRTQVAAALIVSYMGTEPWAGSSRAQAIEDVAEGPPDWASTASVIALMDVALRDAEGRAAAIAALHRCARRPFNATIWQHVVEPASQALRFLGAIEPDEARALDVAQD